MWRALLISLVAHLCIMYLIPSVQILPPGPEYIEIESIWVEESEGEIVQKEGVGEEPVERSESIQPEQPQVEAHVPTNLDAVEPEMVEDSRYAGEDESAIDPWLSEEPQRLAQMSQFQSPVTPPELLPDDAAKDFVPEIPRKIPEPETLETAPVKPELQPPPEALPSSILLEEVPPIPPQIPDEPQVLEIPSFVLSEVLEDTQEPQLLTRLQRSVRNTSLLAPTELTPILKEEREPLLISSSDVSENLEKPETEKIVELEEFLTTEESQEVEAEEPEELPIIEPSERSLLAQVSQDSEPGELSIASYSRRSPVSQQAENVSHPFSRSFKTKIELDSTQSLTDEKLIHREESLAEAATELPLPQQESVAQKPLVQQSRDEPRELQTAQDIFMNISFQPEIPHGFQPPQAPDVKRSFVIGGKTEEQGFVSDRSPMGIVVRKEPILPQEENQDVVLEPDDVDRTSLDEDKGAAFDIEGPAAQRKVLYKPREFPEIQLDTEVNIRLKFWVLPDGSVGEVLPLQRGDIRLERAAIEYLRNWRFTPVAPNQPKVWGIIPITYKLQ